MAIIFIVIIVAGVKVEADKGGKDVIKNVYIYLVLFATLMMTIGGSVAAFMAVADIISPVPYYQTFEEFKRIDNEKLMNNTDKDKTSEAELKKQYDELVLREREMQISRAKNNLVKSFGWIIIPLPVFVYFQRRLVNRDM
ncbi:hypothetical protein SPSYN_02259 [Sporotomaculum syntrophicum]|uniref:Uncharacterized protein n=1 Tax=Sporotomaculum syntrophicum TaxID=182264 RepID=A0A9D2WPE5_9FIRM|nr:hypothetical protein SPSYN_02259 [Sporotomaculum syntrophicum]